MPDMETRIQEWKRSLVLAFGGSGEFVEELESHLREEIDRLTQAGRPADAALAAAQAKLGRPADLAAEIRRAVPPGAVVAHPCGLYAARSLFGYLAWALVLPRFRQGGDVLLGLHIAAIVAGYAVGFYAGLLGICYVACWLSGPSVCHAACSDGLCSPPTPAQPSCCSSGWCWPECGRTTNGAMPGTMIRVKLGL